MLILIAEKIVIHFTSLHYYYSCFRDSMRYYFLPSWKSEDLLAIMFALKKLAAIVLETLRALLWTHINIALKDMLQMLALLKCFFVCFAAALANY